MLEKLIVIDYVDGSGGEYFASFLNAHSGFYNQGIVVDDLQNVSDPILKFFNSTCLVEPDWDNNFETYANQYQQLCGNAKCVATPYHLYKHPRHVKLLLNLAETVRFVKINVTGYKQLVAYDFLRKVYLRKISKDDLSVLSFLTKNKSHDDKRYLLELLKQDKLTYGDIYSTGNKLAEITALVENTTLPTQDIEISYGDFFVDFNNTEHNYSVLCKTLDIEPNWRLLEKLITRNKRNYQTLTEYITNFKYD